MTKPRRAQEQGGPILGINAYHGDAAAALVVDGRLVAAAEEERFSRIKHQAGFPVEAVRWCVESAGIRPSDIGHIAVSRNPSAHLRRKILYALGRRPDMALLRSRLANVARVRDVGAKTAEALGVPELEARVHHVEHHRAHLASAFFVSPFNESAVLSVDGFGDFVSAMWGCGRGSRLEVSGWVEFPHSLGLLYTAATQYLGFPKYGDEYKVMGLAAYGEPLYLDGFSEIVRLEPKGIGYRLDLRFFRHHRDGTNMTWGGGAPTLTPAFSDALIRRFGPRRGPGDPIEPRHQGVAASLQARLEEAMFDILRKLSALTGLRTLCMAGGVALNAVANGKIRAETPFESLFIQPAANDAGTAIGAAFYVYHQVLGRPRLFRMEHAYWGPAYGEGEIGQAVRRWKSELDRAGCRVREWEAWEPLVRWVAERVADGRIVGWCQGAMEFGPRALGNRSILVDPRRAEMKEILNARIKHREAFRPFAPSVTADAVGDFFEQDSPSPFMLMTYRVRPARRASIPATTHVDGTGRVHTVTRDSNPLFWSVLHEFGRRTGVPVLLNTSFNENEPIVCTPDQALDCFLRTRMDLLVLGRLTLERTPRSSGDGR